MTIDSTVTPAQVEQIDTAISEKSERVVINRTSGKFAPHIAGGDAIHSSQYRCSLGFNVRSGEKYQLITAGHCTDIGVPWYSNSGLTTSIGSATQSSFPGNDYAVVDYTNTAVSHPGSVNLYNGTAQAISSAGDPTIAQMVKRSGSTTGVHSGQVIGLNATVNYGEEWGTVTGLIHTNVCSEGGDSRGSLFAGSKALGITSGGSGNCTDGGVTFFQPITEVLRAHSLNISLDGCTSVTGAKVCFQPYGDKFLLTDTSADGAHARVILGSGGKTYTCSNTGGANTTKTCDYNFAEVQSLSYYVAVYDASTFVRKGPTYYDRF